ncbi:MAG: hypothetical protein U9P44_02715, partial [archaeon]|nr:hypothetical protein [archaeon]
EENDLIDNLDVDYKTISEEERKDKHQKIQKDIALILVIFYGILEIVLLISGLYYQRDISFFERHIDSFRLLICVILGYYFSKIN